MLKQTIALFLLLLGACSMTTSVEGSGVTLIDNRALGSFSSVEFAGSFEATVIVGDRNEVVVDGDDNLQKHLITKIDGDTLEVYVERGYSLDPMPTVTVYVTDLASLGLAGSGDLTVTNADSVDLELWIAGSGTMRIEGTCDSLSVDIAGSGDVHCFELEAGSVNIDIAGSADVEVHAREALVVDIAGSGEVLYKGDPSVEQSVAGSGDIRRVTD